MLAAMKELIPPSWVQTPCAFVQPEDSPSAQRCGECERGFGRWWRQGKRHCMFCGYLFHRNGCTRKVHVEGEFFKQRICSRCHYYRSSEAKLKAGEEFECVGNEGTSNVVLSLCEQTAELVMHWKARELKETFDLAKVEVRKGFSHVRQHIITGAGNYEPLLSFSLLLKDGVGDCVYHLRASSALVCQLWVEGLKAACYVYHKMVEQEHAMQFYLDRNMSILTHWFQKRYLPNSSPQSQPPAEDCEEWEVLSANSRACSQLPLTTFQTPSSHGNSSGYQSDLSLSICSSIALPPRQGLTVHSLSLSSRQAAISSRKPCSLPPTPRPAPRTSPATCSLPPTPASTNPLPSFSSTGSSQSHFQFHSAQRE